METPRIRALSTAVPAHVIDQQDAVREAARHWGGAYANIARLKMIFSNASIEKRHSCVPFEWYLADHGFAERNALYVENALALLVEAARDCLAKADLAPEDIDAIVVASSTGIATPSLDALVTEQLALRRDVQRLPIFGLGCAGGVLGLARAGALSRAMPGKNILFLVVELCGLTFRKGDRSAANLVATALFGDGAAGVVLNTEADGPRVAGWGEHTWPGSLDVMGWRVEDDGLAVVFSREIPNIVRKKMRGAMEEYLAREGLSLDEIDEFVCHPGGTKVVDALERILPVAQGGLTHARDVLREYGNMSAATVMFVLERSLKNGASNGAATGAANGAHRRLLSTLGPGFTAGFLLLETG